MIAYKSCNMRNLCCRTLSLCRSPWTQKNSNSEINNEKKEPTLRISNNFQYSDCMRSVAIPVPSGEINKIQNLTDVAKSTKYFSVSEDLIEEEKIYRLHPPVKMRRPNKLEINIQGEIIYGVHPVHLALLSKRRSIFQLYIYKRLSRSDDLKEKIHQQALDLGIPIKEVSKNILSKISEGHVHQGICLDASKLKMQDFEESSAESTSVEDNSFCLLLDRVQDPMNFGAVLRSSYYFGVNRVFAVKESSCKLSPVVSKASSGAMEVLPVYAVNDLPAFLESKKERGCKIIGSDVYSISHDQKYIGIDEIEVTKPTIFILGNEGKGMSRNVYDLCDRIATIKPRKNMCPDIGSLNVSVVCGIILHQLLGRQTL